jgi:hypothetical protein
MNHHISRKFVRLSLAGLLLTAIISVTACGPSGYQEPIGKFQSSSSVVIASTRLYVSELNKVERDQYVNRQLSARAEISVGEIEAVQVFNQEGLKARLDALDQLAKYGNLLSKLAKSDAPEKVQAEAKDLGDSVNTLSNTVAGLSGASNDKFKAAVTPVTAIVGQILSFIIERKIERALDKAIKEGEVPINNLIAVIRDDIQIAYQLKRNSFSESRKTLVREYNRELGKGASADVEQLRILADRIRANEDRWEILATANPGEGLDAMAKAHSALIDYAKSAHKVSDLASLVSAMESFAARASAIGKAVQSLREI